MDTFTTEVYPRMLQYITTCFRDDEEKQSIALCFAWYLWNNRKVDLPPAIFARAAVRYVRMGRDLPHIYPHRTQEDAMDYGCWRCGGMGETLDRQPRPDKVAERRELISRLKSVADAAEEVVIDMLLDGYTQREIARELGVTPHTVIAIKRRLRDKL